MNQVRNFNFLRIFVLTLILFSFFPNNKVFSFDWLSWGGYEVYPNCLPPGPNFSRPNPLEGFYDYTEAGPCQGCRYKIIYDTRWTGPNNDDFEILIREVLLESGGSNCSTPACDKYNIIYGFIHQLLEDYANYIPGFITKYRKNLPIGTLIPITVYGQANCFSGVEPYLSECDNIKRCCKRTLLTKLILENGIYKEMEQTWDQLTLTIPVGCPNENCHPYCNYSPFRNDPDQCYDCEIGNWIPRVEIFSVAAPGCPSCQLKITFDFRTNASCSPPWKEYRIIEIERINCNGCFAYPYDLFSMANSLLLEYGPIEPPNYPEEQENWRIIKAKCFSTTDEISRECPGSVACCKFYYRVWKDINGLRQSSAIQTVESYPMEQCQAPCEFFCEDLTHQGANSVKSEEKLDNSVSISYVIPNPAKNIFDIYLNSKKMGSLKIKLFDILGNSVYETSLNKTSYELIVPIDAVNYAKGIYQYMFELNGIILVKGSVIIK